MMRAVSITLNMFVYLVADTNVNKDKINGKVFLKNKKNSPVSYTYWFNAPSFS